MSKYILMQSKSPWESGDIGHFYSLARELGQPCRPSSFTATSSWARYHRTAETLPAVFVRRAESLEASSPATRLRTASA